MCIRCVTRLEFVSLPPAKPRARRLDTLRRQNDFSKAKRAKSIPHLAKLQADTKGKTRITIMLDNDLLIAFRAKADSEGMGYQTLINQTLRDRKSVV